MAVLVDTSVLVDYLRGNVEAAAVLERERTAAPLHASDITRLDARLLTRNVRHFPMLPGLRAPY